MSKIYNIIPGVLNNDVSIIDRIFTLIDNVKFVEWIEVNEQVYSLEFFQRNDEFYVMYLDPQEVIKKLYITCRNDIVHFMKTHINYKYGDGIDIVICTKEINNAVVCNHDGQIFILKV